MLLKRTALDKVPLVPSGQGLRLWRLLIEKYEPQWRSRQTALHQAVLVLAAVARVLRRILVLPWFTFERSVAMRAEQALQEHQSRYRAAGGVYAKADSRGISCARACDPRRQGPQLA